MLRGTTATTPKVAVAAETAGETDDANAAGIEIIGSGGGGEIRMRWLRRRDRSRRRRKSDWRDDMEEFIRKCLEHS